MFNRSKAQFICNTALYSVEAQLNNLWVEIEPWTKQP